jgi:hypothetical protein
VARCSAVPACDDITPTSSGHDLIDWVQPTCDCTVMGEGRILTHSIMSISSVDIGDSDDVDLLRSMKCMGVCQVLKHTYLREKI